MASNEQSMDEMTESRLAVADEGGERHTGQPQQTQDERTTTSATPDDDTRKKEATQQQQQQQHKIHKLSLSKTHDFNDRLRKRGVVYVARVPPRMNPTKLRVLLSDCGSTVTRVYLVEEDASKRGRRRKMTGNGRKRYVEGWVEFDDKKIAKHVARSLNNTPISMHKRNVHYGELWNLKYLHKFQWSHLTEKVAYERRVREQKLRIELMSARRENASYSQLVETGKKLDKIEERRRKRKRNTIATAAAEQDVKTVNDDLDMGHKHRRPKQTKPMKEGTEKAAKHVVLSSLV